MARLRLLLSSLPLAKFFEPSFTLPDARLDDSKAPGAFRMLGSDFVSNLTRVPNLEQDIFGRQACGAGYGQCGNTGECCPENEGANCCQTFCIGLQPAGTNCCNGYMCPPNWNCCGTSGNHCRPSDGVCCTPDGIYCPAQWSCCGNLGHCYPTDGWHCCSNNGEFCPDGSKCVYCTGSSTLICCEGADGSIDPPYNTGIPAGSGSTPTSLAIPEPSTPAAANTAVPATSSSEASSINSITTPDIITSAPETAYYSTIFTYSYTIWTRITYIESIVDFTITTTYTVLSCLATDSADAMPTLFSLASSVEASASSSAAAASPLDTGSSSTASATAPVVTKAGASGGSTVMWSWNFLALAMTFGIMVQLLA